MPRHFHGTPIRDYQRAAATRLWDENEPLPSPARVKPVKASASPSPVQRHTPQQQWPVNCEFPSLPAKDPPRRVVPPSPTLGGGSAGHPSSPRRERKANVAAPGASPGRSTQVTSDGSTSANLKLDFMSSAETAVGAHSTAPPTTSPSSSCEAPPPRPSTVHGVPTRAYSASRHIIARSERLAEIGGTVRFGYWPIRPQSTRSTNQTDSFPSDEHEQQSEDAVLDSWAAEMSRPQSARTTRPQSARMSRPQSAVRS